MTPSASAANSRLLSVARVITGTEPVFFRALVGCFVEVVLCGRRAARISVSFRFMTSAPGTDHAPNPPEGVAHTMPEHGAGAAASVEIHGVGDTIKTMLYKRRLVFCATRCRNGVACKHR